MSKAELNSTPSHVHTCGTYGTWNVRDDFFERKIFVL